MRTWFKTVCSKNNLEISDIQLDTLTNFADKLLEWNKRINLISRKDEVNVWSKHILSSFSFLSRFYLETPSAVLDVGTGGGLPGIPLAIMLPRNTFVLIDSIQKKINAVQEIIASLALSNVTAICGRVEEFARMEAQKQSYDYVIARAVGSVKEITHWVKPAVNPPRKGTPPPDVPSENRRLIRRGSILLLKGGDLFDEIEQARIKMRPTNIEAFPLSLAGIDPADVFEKKLVIVEP